MITLLFWVLISATDPVAVLSLFKKLGVPNRLALIFEGESLFNDGTAYAMFIVILWMLTHWTVSSWAVFSWIGTFLSMSIGGIIFWIFMWMLFATIIWMIHNSRIVEITLTIVLALLTFTLAELISEATIFWMHIKISWVIATTLSAIIMWNYGKYKITPLIWDYMNKYWQFLAFIANALVFILVGLIFTQLEIDLNFFVFPVLITILVVVLARAVAVYLPIWILNKLKIEEEVPMAWQHLLSWWSLRWAIAIVMVLLVPRDFTIAWWMYDFSIRDFLFVLTMGCILFSLFVKALTMPILIRKLEVNKLDEAELFTHFEWEVLISVRVLTKIDELFDRWVLWKEECEELKNRYNERLSAWMWELKDIVWKNPKMKKTLFLKVLSLHALGIEKFYLMQLFAYNEIDEDSFKYIMHKIFRQKERIESDQSQISDINETNDYDFLERIRILITFDKDTEIDRYLRNRTKVIIAKKVIYELERLQRALFWFQDESFDKIITLYKQFIKISEDKMKNIGQRNRLSILAIEARLVEKSLLHEEEIVVNSLYKKEMLSKKVQVKFLENILEGIMKDVKFLG